MKIAIFGTRGIPNNYGGFEQFTENISVKLVKKGHDVIVYNPAYHLYKKDEFFGVKIIKKISPEKLLGPFANCIYDFLCLKDAIRQNCDIVLACGYTSSPLSYFLFNLKRIILISNMDGLEWKRSKWGFLAKKLILLGEILAVKKSHYLIADNLFIAEYIKSKFNKPSEYIPYAAEIIKEKDLSGDVLKKFGVEKDEYYLIVGRGVPENNIETIIKGVLLSKSDKKLVIVSSLLSKYLKLIFEKYKENEQIVFPGEIYDKNVLNALRYYSTLYFHGHSVGGTNPSLLEAMSAKCLICAHDNKFNRSVLGEDGLYFETKENIKNHIQTVKKFESSKNQFVESNLNKMREIYNWNDISDKYEKFFLKAIKERNN